MAGVTSGRLERLERFLDDLDNVKNPYTIEEPFKTLWFRIHGQDPGKVSDRGELPSPSAVLDTDTSVRGADLDDFEISPASKEGIKGLEDGSKKGRIEIISPKEIGPTIEMKIEEKEKVTFRAAVGDDLKAAKMKEEAAKKLMEIQNTASPLKGMGGDAGKIHDMIKDMAMSYRDGSYENVNDLAKEIEDRLNDLEFRRSVFAYLKGKIEDYEKVGGDLTPAREGYKELATSFREEREDFISLVGACNTQVEDAVKDILSESVAVEVVSVKTLPAKTKKKAVTSQKKIDRPMVGPKKIVKRAVSQVKQASKPPAPVQKTVEKPLEEKEDFEIEVPAQEEKPPAQERSKESATRSESPPQPEQKPKEAEEVKPVPVIKTQVVKKKLVQLVPKKEVPVGDQKTPGVSAKPKPETTQPQPKQEKAKETPAPEPQVENEATPPKETAPAPQPESQPKQEDMPPEKIDEAFKKIQFVYDVAMKMHSGGRDVSQIFDMLNYAEKVRAEGNMKTYAGVASQCEAMVIQLQAQ